MTNILSNTTASMFRFKALLRIVGAAVALACVVLALVGASAAGASSDYGVAVQNVLELDDATASIDIEDTVFFVPATLVATHPVWRIPVEGAARFSSQSPQPRLRPPRLT